MFIDEREIDAVAIVQQCAAEVTAAVETLRKAEARLNSAFLGWELLIGIPGDLSENPNPGVQEILEEMRVAKAEYQMAAFLERQKQFLYTRMCEVYTAPAEKPEP